MDERDELHARVACDKQCGDDQQAGDQFDAGTGMCCILHSCFLLLPMSSRLMHARRRLWDVQATRPQAGSATHLAHGRRRRINRFLVGIVFGTPVTFLLAARKIVLMGAKSPRHIRTTRGREPKAIGFYTFHMGGRTVEVPRVSNTENDTRLADQGKIRMTLTFDLLSKHS